LIGGVFDRRQFDNTSSLLEDLIGSGANEESVLTFGDRDLEFSE
jgi:hypothetical protein